MAEASGPSNQDGIYYQNTVAAQYLAELLSLQSTPPAETVTEVRVEAPTHVDDIVVRYADGHRDWIQAKSNLSASGDDWGKLWKSFSEQSADSTFSCDDRLVIALGKRAGLSEKLQALLERASTSQDTNELLHRMSAPQRKMYESIVSALPEGVSALEILKVTELRVKSLADIDAFFSRLDLGTASAAPRALLSNLRDLVGGAARVRGTFWALQLRKRLSQEFGTDLFEPREWGLAAYRDTLRRSSRIEIPGRGISAPVQDVVVWPRVYRHDSLPQQDFDNETPSWDPLEGAKDQHLENFPQADFSRCILIAGPGMGKSALVTALSAKLARSPIVPVNISLSAFAANEQSVIEYLDGTINRDFSVRVNWKRLAEQGLLCVFFDGLDEVPSVKRGKVLKIVNLFTSRFPAVPWLLTVRDPAALNGPLEGDLFELQLFDNPEISKLIKRYKEWSPGLDEWSFIENLQAHPDLARLARIPLFLSIMLSDWKPEATPPKKRSDIIERYLNLLFEPGRETEHIGFAISGTELRSVAQALAFHSLEREEIGLTKRHAATVIALHADGPVDSILGQLMSCGVLRYGSGGRLQFPYPIVQEYLAASYLVESAREQISARIQDVIKRPWAQVIQFALELLPDATPHIEQMLESPDDVFSTGLRLVGRCVANGATVSLEIRDHIGTLLAEVWGKATYRVRDRVGPLIVDAYSNPIHPEVRRRLGWSWLLASGSGTIICRADDPDLILSVVDDIFSNNLKPHLNLWVIQVPLQKVAPDVARKIVQRARSNAQSDDEIDGLIGFLEKISVGGADARPLVELGEDQNMPMKLRLAAFGSVVDRASENALELARCGLESDDWKVQSESLRVLRRSPDQVQAVKQILGDASVPLRAKDYLVESLRNIFDGTQSTGRAAHALLESTNLSQRHADILRVYRLHTGDRSLMIEMIDRLSEVPSEIANAVLILLNHFPEKSIGLEACRQLQRRQVPPSDIPGIAQSALTGLTHTIDSFGWNGYGLTEAPPHPSIQAWLPLFESWFQTAGMTKIQRLRLLSGFVRFHPELVAEIKDIVLSVHDPDASEWDEDDYGHTLRRGLDNLTRWRIDVPLDLAETFILSKRPNLPYAGIKVFSAQASHEALNRLLLLYRKVDRDRQVDILDALEVIANRLGVSITEQDLTAT